MNICERKKQKIYQIVYEIEKKEMLDLGYNMIEASVNATKIAKAFIEEENEEELDKLVKNLYGQ